jgi:K+-sensing histidine kinase KdpD
MSLDPERQQSFARSSRRSWPVRYGGACLSVIVATSVWSSSSLMHQDPFAIFVLSVVFTARFLGFGPAVFGTALSVLTLDFFAFEPHFSLNLHSSDLARLVIFVFISLLAASLARQRSRAEVRADQSLEQVAAIVTSSEDAIYSATTASSPVGIRARKSYTDIAPTRCSASRF